MKNLCGGNDYLKTAVDEIQWIEAAGSYFRIVNLRHVETLVGNSLKIGNELLAIGRSCHDQCFTEVDAANGILPASAPVGQKRRKA